MKMVFINLPSAGLCRVLKDPKRNGGKTPEQLVKHVAEDELVLWAGARRPARAGVRPSRAIRWRVQGLGFGRHACPAR
jgi:hypothetical protein